MRQQQQPYLMRVLVSAVQQLPAPLRQIARPIREMGADQFGGQALVGGAGRTGIGPDGRSAAAAPVQRGDDGIEVFAAQCSSQFAFEFGEFSTHLRLRSAACWSISSQASKNSAIGAETGP